MNLDDAMDNGDVPAIDVEHHYFTSPEGLLAHVQEEDVSSVEGGLHAATEHNHNLRSHSMYVFRAVCLRIWERTGTSA